MKFQENCSHVINSCQIITREKIVQNVSCVMRKNGKQFLFLVYIFTLLTVYFISDEKFRRKFEFSRRSRGKKSQNVFHRSKWKKCCECSWNLSSFIPLLLTSKMHNGMKVIFTQHTYAESFALYLRAEKSVSFVEKQI